MNTAKALIYGTTSDGSGCPSMPSGPECPFDDEGGSCDSSARCGGSAPYPDCLDGADGGRAGRGKGASHENGEVWWTSYEEPDKPVEDFTAREIGVHGEVLAARYLSDRGMEILQQNWRSKAGEIDIVARQEDGEVALVEVKTRLDLDGDPQCMPELAVDGRKQRRYRKTALIYLMCHPEVVKMRFDVIAINILNRHNARLRHLVGAFSWDS